MRLAIATYGHPILRQKCKDIPEGFPGLEKIITDMWQMMDTANGCGLAAPQTGYGLKLFIADSKTIYEHLDSSERLNYFEPGDQGIQETFINAFISSHSQELWEDYEGCLSIPGLSHRITRPWAITIEYLNARYVASKEKTHGSYRPNRTA